MASEKHAPPQGGCRSDARDAIQVRGLVKRYGRRLALNELSFSVPVRTVFGFLGPNGAGKSTTIRILLGLVRADAGHAHIAGIQQPAGVLLENPSFFPSLTARDSLVTLADWAGDRGARARVDSLLDRVGLASAAGQRVGGFSQGQRQRLGLASALLRDPPLLILDEPSNGLDPAGMREFRDLLIELRDAGKTIFLSSHLLAEVEKLCNQVCIIAEGEARFEGRISELVQGDEDLEEAFLRLTKGSR